MKVAILFDSLNFSGGIIHQTLSTLYSLNDKDFSDINFEIITPAHIDTDELRNFQKKIKIFNFHKSAERFNKLVKSKVINLIFKKFNIINPFEKFLKKNKYDLVFFLSPSKYVEYCGEHNFIINIFDLNHRLENSFPEYRRKSEIEETDEIIYKSVKYAYKIFVNSNQAMNDLSDIYGCPQQKISILSYNSSLIEEHKKISSNKDQMNNFENIFSNFKFNKKENIFFYPAQFWPHKNHKYLIDVATILEKKKIDFKFIFCGAKKLNYDYINNLVDLNNLNLKIEVFDYLSDQEVISLYLNCSAVLMPTYVGRTSLPLIESFYFKKPIFYSKGILDKEIENFVYPFDLNNPNDLALKIESFLKLGSKVKDENKQKAYEFFSESFNLSKSNKIIFDTIIKFKYLMGRWK